MNTHFHARSHHQTNRHRRRQIYSDIAYVLAKAAASTRLLQTIFLMLWADSFGSIPVSHSLSDRTEKVNFCLHVFLFLSRNFLKLPMFAERPDGIH